MYFLNRPLRAEAANKERQHLNNTRLIGLLNEIDDLSDRVELFDIVPGFHGEMAIEESYNIVKEEAHYRQLPQHQERVSLVTNTVTNTVISS